MEGHCWQESKDMVQVGIPASGPNDSSSGVPAYPGRKIEGSKILEHLNDCGAF
jgi:hypothetical protein